MEFDNRRSTLAQDSHRIIEMVMGYRSAKILLVAVHFNLFTIIDEGKRSLGQLSSAAKINPRAAAILLDSLVSMGFLKKTGEKYLNASISNNVLVAGKPGYIGNNLKYQELIWDAWSGLKDVVRTGKAQEPLEQKLFQNKVFSREYILGMRNIARKPAREIASIIPVERLQKMLDVGAGPGTYSLALLEKNKKLEADLLDLPSTVKISRELIKHHAASSRVHFIEGDYNRVSFGRGIYDLVLMSNITHDEGERENGNLIKKAYASLKPGGLIVIHDFLVGSDKTSPLFGAMFSVHMLVYTSKGRTYSFDEYSAWLKKSGFSAIRRYAIAKDLPNSSHAIIAKRPKD